MKVKELIAELQKLSPDDELEVTGIVKVECGECGCGGPTTAYWNIDGVDSVPPRIRLETQKHWT